MKDPSPVTVSPPTRAALSFTAALRRHGLEPLRRAPLSTLQVNLGRLCNQACEHCHVDAGPKRTEIMSRTIMDRIVRWCGDNGISDVDITGGAPEMNPGFRGFVDRLLDTGAAVGVRCNLTILLESGYEDLADWYARRHIHLTCSLPCYSRENVDGQRGKGVFDRSIEALKRLNAAGYGKDPALVLDLVYNPGGAFLPPPQAALEQEYKRELAGRFGIVFNRLLALANLLWFVFAGLGALTLQVGMVPSGVQWVARLTPSGALTEALSRAMLLSLDWFGLAVLAAWGAAAGLCALRWFRFT